MQSGFINKVAVTPANITDATGFKHIYPSQGALSYPDKRYCVSPRPKIAKVNRVHLAAIERENMKTKNRNRDRWYSSMRFPYERAFSKREKRVRYRGVAKINLQYLCRPFALT